MADLWRDLRYGMRMLLRTPVFTLVAVLSLALGIGASTAIFSLTNALLLRPLAGIKDPNGLVWIFSSTRNGSRAVSTSYPTYLDFKEQSQSFSGIAAFSGLPLSLKSKGEPEVVKGQIVSGNYFTVTGSEPTLGRGFVPTDDQPGAPAAAVVSHALWQQRLGATPNAVGQNIVLNGITFTVVGVAPEGFIGLEVGSTPDVWVPLSMGTQLVLPAEGGQKKAEKDIFSNRGDGWLNLMGRLKPGATIEQARAELMTISSRLAQEHQDTNKSIGVLVFPAHSGLDPRERQEMLPVAGILLAIMGLVLLIVCTNLANLLLARSSIRQREVGVRMALGAGRRRMIQQLLTESLLLSLLGGGLGLALGLSISSLIVASLSVPVTVELDFRVLAFTAVVSLATVLVFGLAPALNTSRVDLVSVIKDAAAVKAGRPRSRLRRALVVSQVTLSLVLLICAGFFLRSVQKAQAVDLGLDPHNVLLVPLDLSLQNYPEAKGQALYQNVVDQLSGLPGVQSVAVAEHVPLDQSSFSQSRVTVEGQEPDPRNSDAFTVATNTVGLDYFKTLKIAIMRGRDFDEQDRGGGPGVVIINEAMARRFWPNEDPIGKRLGLGNSPADLTVVGVAQNGTYRTVGEIPRPYMYHFLPRHYAPKVTVMLRSSAPEALAGEVRNRVQTLDANIAVSNIRTLDAHVSQSFGPARIAALLLGCFGLVALVLAAIGIYAVTAYSVSQRTKEIGIRMALGASPRGSILLVMRESMMLVVFGVGGGLLLGLGLTMLLSSLVYGTAAFDPLVFLPIPLALLGVALLASYVPARRAARVEPMVALRYL